ncbi:JmjC domain-containing protein [Strongyloides ratti]|uniref:JmjC domain-containing protein n=1 Tax=Strongyloides ratti TaxID=34506 RepID=A0A090KXK9_STRRB|nr:JmjC domain-containing protein [Strongyloides ratti]CEF60612.1 JmjC domain-containing protein [Strongyloides ratti]
MSRITRSNTYHIQKNEITIRGYELLNFSNAKTSENFLRPDMYKIINENEELDMNYFREETCNVPVLFLCSRLKLGIQCSEINYENFEIIESNLPRNFMCSVIIDNKPGTKEMVLSEVLENMKIEYSKRKHIYNCLSLNYTFMALEDVFTCPNFVIEMNLAINNWPDVLKIAQICCDKDKEIIFPMTWNYCTVSTKGLYTNFHIDFGNNSVWISVISGKKTWWYIPSAKYIIAAFEQYLKDSCSSKDFFGFCAANCCKITLTARQSFFLLAGWIHAVYTNKDTLMVGGNFLTSAALETHLQIVESEQRQKAEVAYTYVYFKKLMWYTVADIVYNVTGLEYINYKVLKITNMLKCVSVIFFINKMKKKLNLVKRYLKNKNIKNELINGSYFKKNTSNHVTYETAVKHNNISKWTFKKAKSHKSLLDFIKKHRKLMDKNLPVGIINCDQMIKDFERIIIFAFKEIFKLNGESVYPSTIS